MAWPNLRHYAVQLVVTRPVIYHGIFGEGFFQSIYPVPQSEVVVYLSSIEWVVLTIFLFGLGILVLGLRIVPYLMLGGTFCVALSCTWCARALNRNSIRCTRVFW